MLSFINQLTLKRMFDPDVDQTVPHQPATTVQHKDPTQEMEPIDIEENERTNEKNMKERIEE